MYSVFPKLQSSPHRVTSPKTPDYNCIAWAAGEKTRFWAPILADEYYWPTEIPSVVTVETITEAFESLDYSVCEDGGDEAGYEKIAIYAKPSGEPTHASKQVNKDKWSSKLGKDVDIEHEIDALNSDFYGQPVIFMKRPIREPEVSVE
jgi:hypothetical protein